MKGNVKDSLLGECVYVCVFIYIYIYIHYIYIYIYKLVYIMYIHIYIYIYSGFKGPKSKRLRKSKGFGAVFGAWGCKARVLG